MERIWYFKLSIVIAIVVVSGVCVLGAMPDRVAIPVITDNVNTELQLGLDLSGGVRLVYEVLIDDAVRQRRRQAADGMATVVEDDLHVKNVAFREQGQRRFSLLFENQADASKVDHSFVRGQHWATDIGRGGASEAHFAVVEGASRSVRATTRAAEQAVATALGVEGLEAESLQGRGFALVFPDSGTLGRLTDEVVEGLSDVELVGRYSQSVDLELEQEVYETVVNDSVNQAMDVIRNRIDELGVANTNVSQSGTNIIVEIPASQNRDDEAQNAFVGRTKRIIERTARLEFRIADDQERNLYSKLRPAVTADERVELVPDTNSFFLRASDTKLPSGKVIKGNTLLSEFVERALDKGIDMPEGRELMFERIPSRRSSRKNAAPEEEVWRSYLLKTEVRVAGEHISDAQVAYEQSGPNSGMPYVALSFNDRGRKAFGDVTAENVNKRMAVVLDNRINSAPVIQEAIRGGHARITLGGNNRQQALEEAQDLVYVLRAGGLPAPITLVNEETIGANLGEDSIQRGQLSIMVGAGLVLIFMLIYYRAAGLVADVALIINLGMIFAALGLLKATLTLPGLAGIVLTVGMAVDANVIIYERIREELRAGKSPRAAVEAGYGRAFWTIFDAQFTTLIAAVVLLDQGTGPIKGFAVTLLIGIVTSMISAIFVTRVAFDWMTQRKRLERSSI